MNDDFHSHSGSGGQEMASQRLSPVLSSRSGSFFQSVDWLSFALTTAIALAVYLFTLALDVTLDQGVSELGILTSNKLL